MKTSKRILLITLAYLIGAGLSIWFDKIERMSGYVQPILGFAVLMLQYAVERTREKRWARGVDPAEKEPWYLCLWFDFRGAFLLAILNAVSLFWRDIRYIGWPVYRTYIWTSVLFALIGLIDLIRYLTDKQYPASTAADQGST